LHHHPVGTEDGAQRPLDFLLQPLLKIDPDFFLLLIDRAQLGIG